MYKDIKLRYFNGATSEDIGLGRIDKDFESEEEVLEYIEDYAKNFFWWHSADEDPDSEIYAENETSKFHSKKAKKFSCPSGYEPFDSDREKDVDFNGGLEWY